MEAIHIFLDNIYLPKGNCLPPNIITTTTIIITLALACSKVGTEGISYIASILVFPLSGRSPPSFGISLHSRRPTPGQTVPNNRVEMIFFLEIPKEIFRDNGNLSLSFLVNIFR